VSPTSNVRGCRRSNSLVSSTSYARAMLHEPSIVADTTPWDVAEGEVDRWRGACIQVFARCESAITEALLVLTEGAVAKPRLPHLVGQRFEKLDAAVTGGKVPSGGAARLKTALDAFRAHDDLRTILCHGSAQVAVDRCGEWLAVFRCIACRSGGTDHVVRTFTALQADEALVQLRHDGQVLNLMLGQLCKSMKSEA